MPTRFGDAPKGAPESFRIRLSEKDLFQFSQNYASCVFAQGIVLHTLKLPAVGTHVAFELQLANGSPALRGEGIIRAIGSNGATFGIEFVSIDGPSRALLDSILLLKKATRERRAANTPPTGEWSLQD